MTRRRFLPRALGVTALALLAGFAWFVQLTGSQFSAPDRADAIAVLTGGPDRVETGLRLLAAGHAPRLLISGVGGGADLAELAGRAEPNLPVLARRTHLGRAATSTRTNALEIAGWAGQTRIRSLIVVTAAYHLPRALLELHRQMPEVTLYPVATSRPVGWRGLPAEYAKYLAALAHLSRLTDPPHPLPPPEPAG